MTDNNGLKNKLFFASLLALFAAGVAAYLVDYLPWIWRALLVLAGALAVTSAWLGREALQSSLSRRTVRYGLNSVFMSLVALAIVVVLNMIASNHDAKFDVTKSGLHTLSDQTVKVLKGLEQPVNLTAYIHPIQRQQLSDALGKYSHHSANLKVVFVDPDRDPMAFRRHQIKGEWAIVVESGARTVKVDSLSGPDDPKFEQKLTNAIIQVNKGEKRKIYFVTGHGELLTSDQGKQGYSETKAALEAGRYHVEDLNLLEKDTVPSDAEALVFPGPRKQFASHEWTALDGFVRAGGRVLMMVEPDSTPELKDWLGKHGIDWTPGSTIVERSPTQQLAGGNPLSPVVLEYDATHEITRDLRQQTLFAIATPLEKAKTVPEGLSATRLMNTSRQSLRATLQGNEIRMDGEKRGPFGLGVAVSGKTEGGEAQKKESPSEKPGEFRVVAVGDADFASNGLRGYGMNTDLFENMLSWLVQEEDLISIRPRPADQSHLDITLGRTRVIVLSSVVLLPFLMLVSGFYVGYRRRSL